MRARRLVLAAATAIIVAGCASAGAPTSSPTPSPSHEPVATATPEPSTPGTPPTSSPSATATPRATPNTTVVPATLPVRDDASDIATGVQMAPRAGSGLFVVVPASGGTVLASLDAEGAVRAGWPLLLPGASRCWIGADRTDDSVRAVCAIGDAAARAYAFDAAGHPLAGWPVDLQGEWPAVWGSAGAALIEGDLFMVLRVTEGAEATLVRVSRDGSVIASPRVEGGGAGNVIGPDGTAYLKSVGSRDPAGMTPMTTISALTLAGPKAGFPVEIDGMASEPSFSQAGRLYLATDALVPDGGQSYGRPDSSSKVIALSEDGRVIDGWPLTIPIDNSVGTSDGAPGPAARPVAGPDGSVYLVGWGDDHRTVAFAFDPSGRSRSGWPYRSKASVAYQPGWSDCACQCQPCSCGTFYTPPAGSPSGRLIVVEGGGYGQGGDRIAAIGADGKVAAGWPVYLDDEGAWFAGMAVGDDGVVYGYAIEPAGNRATSECPEAEMVYSGTIVALDGHGDPIYTTTLVLP